MTKPKSTTVHGNMMVIDGIGVLIHGEASVGKSELCLALLDRGHTLVSDDATEISCNDGKLIACCPRAINNFMQINYVGTINIEKCYGNNATCTTHPIDLAIHLANIDKLRPLKEPMQPLSSHYTVCDTSILQFDLPNTAGRHLHLLVEILVKNFKQKQAGYDAFEELHQHQNQSLKEDAQCKKHN